MDLDVKTLQLSKGNLSEECSKLKTANEALRKQNLDQFLQTSRLENDRSKEAAELSSVKQELHRSAENHQHCAEHSTQNMATIQDLTSEKTQLATLSILHSPKLSRLRRALLPSGNASLIWRR